MKKGRRTVLAAALCLAALLMTAFTVLAANGVFTINKVDQYKNPIEGVEFEVYGKPEMKLDTKGVTIRKVRKTVSRGGTEGYIEYSIAQLVNMEFIQPEVTVVIEGIDGTEYSHSFSTSSDREVEEGDKATGVLVTTEELELPVGKYRISETIPLHVSESESPDLYNYNHNAFQYYLQSYEFEVKEDGSVTVTGGPEWKGLESVGTYHQDTQTMTYQFVQFDIDNMKPEYDVGYTNAKGNVDASIQDNVITIVNYSATYRHK